MRSKKDGRVDTKTERLKLEVRGEPYWVVLEKGRSLGYRKGVRGGEWVARYYDPLNKPSRRYHPLGSSDDLADADGVLVLSYVQAQEAARQWFKVAYSEARGERPESGPVTVALAVAEYLADRKRNGAKTADRMAYDLNAHVIPSLGDIVLERLSKQRLEKWMDDMAASGRRVRGVVQEPAKTKEEKTSRKATANRVWNLFRAALNLAARNHKIEPTWKGVTAFKGATQARIRFLSKDEQSRLIKHCESLDFRRLVEGALTLGARESELGRIVAGDFDPIAGQVWIAPGKTGKGRHVVMDAPGIRKFKVWCKGLKPKDPVFPRLEYARTDKRSDGEWKKVPVLRALKDACVNAGIEPMTFHELRHTYASALVNRGVPLVFVAAQLGHRDTSMVEKHYGHLCDVARAQAIRRR